MNVTTDTFDTNMSTWKEWQNAPWGRLRYNLVQANLRRHRDFHRQPLHILDVGGGNGLEAINLATQGHQVTLTDFSEQMLSEAQRNAEKAEVSANLTFHQTDVTALQEIFSDTCFDVVLCHNVIQYVEDAEGLIHRMSRLTKPKGLLSILCVNRYSEPYKAAIQRQDLAGAQASLQGKEAVARLFDVSVKRYAAQEIINMLDKLGVRMLGQYGIRSVCDYIVDNEMKAEPDKYKELERLEYAMSDKYPYYLVARFFQIIGSNEP